MHGRKRRVNQLDILTRWYEYTSGLYSDDNRVTHNSTITGVIFHRFNEESIAHREVEAALKILPMKKLPGIDDITAEMLVAAGQNGRQTSYVV